MKFSTATAILISLRMTSVLAFITPRTSNSNANHDVRATSTVSNEIEKTQKQTPAEERPLYDPLGLYPKSSEDQGRIRPFFAEENTELESAKLNLYRKVRDPMGLYPKNSPEFQEALQEEQATVIANNEKPLYDPMNLYQANSVERREGLIQTMEPPLDQIASDTIAKLKETKDPLGLYPADSQEFTKSLALEVQERESINSDRQLFDPLGLYSKDAPEYQEGKIRSLEPEVNVVKPVLDPLNIYPSESKAEVEDDVVMSKALPFMAKPASLTGDLVGDAGFDPLGFAKTNEGLLWQREAELKHSRIAMLAAAGWPLAELFHGTLSALTHLQPLLVEGDRVPSILNGGLQQVNPFYWMGILAVAGLFESVDIMMNNNSENKQSFDPLGLFPADEEGQERMQLAEIKNGRLAMMAITAFAAIEAITHEAVINVTPFLFHPPSF